MEAECTMSRRKIEKCSGRTDRRNENKKLTLTKTSRRSSKLSCQPYCLLSIYCFVFHYFSPFCSLQVNSTVCVAVILLNNDDGVGRHGHHFLSKWLQLPWHAVPGWFFLPKECKIYFTSVTGNTCTCSVRNSRWEDVQHRASSGTWHIKSVELKTKTLNHT